MPIPKPNAGESRSNFMSRCMGDKTMTDEYGKDQRLAVCSASYNSKEEEQVNDEKREVSKDVFTTEEEAEARAEEAQAHEGRAAGGVTRGGEAVG